MSARRRSAPTELPVYLSVTEEGPPGDLTPLLDLLIKRGCAAHPEIVTPEVRRILDHMENRLNEQDSPVSLPGQAPLPAPPDDQTAPPLSQTPHRKRPTKRKRK